MNKFKLLLLLGVLISTLSCEESDDTEPTFIQFPAKITPPDWIQGEWMLQNPKEHYTGFVFKADDFCQILNTLETNDNLGCYKHQIIEHNNAGLKNEVDQNSDENRYELEITLFEDTTSYVFQRIDSLNIEWVILDKNDPDIEIFIPLKRP